MQEHCLDVFVDGFLSVISCFSIAFEYEHLRRKSDAGFRMTKYQNAPREQLAHLIMRNRARMIRFLSTVSSRLNESHGFRIGCLRVRKVSVVFAQLASLSFEPLGPLRCHAARYDFQIR